MKIIILTVTYIAANTSQPPIRIQFGVSLVGFSGDFDVSPADFVPNLEDEVNIFILVWSNSYVQLILGSFPHTGKCRRFTENNLPSNTNVCNVYQIIQTMKLYIHTHHCLVAQNCSGEMANYNIDIIALWHHFLLKITKPIFHWKTYLHCFIQPVKRFRAGVDLDCVLHPILHFKVLCTPHHCKI